MERFREEQSEDPVDINRQIQRRRIIDILDSGTVDKPAERSPRRLKSE